MAGDVPDNTASSKYTVVTARMVMGFFGASVTVTGVYSSARISLEGRLQLDKHETGVLEQLKKLLPPLIEKVFPDISLCELAFGVQFDKAKGLDHYSVEGTIAINDRKIKFKLFNKKDATLVSLHLPGLISLDKLPLVGEYLNKEDGISDLQVVYYDEKNTYDKAFAGLMAEPAMLADFPSYKAVISKELNIFAGIRIGGFHMPVAYPLKALEDKTPVEIAKDQADKKKEEKPEDKAAQPAVPVPPKKKFLDVKKTQLIYKNGKIGFLFSGAVSISVFELEVMGLQALADLSILQDFSLQKLSFGLEGLSINIQKPPLSLTGAFLRVKSDKPEKADDYFGLLNIGFKQFQFTAIGAYSKQADYTSIFVYAFIGLPLGGPPFFFVTGLAFGMGINRDFILPDIGKISKFPLLAVCMEQNTQNAVKPPDNNKDGALAMLELLSGSIPAVPGAYFLIAGIRFESFKVIRTIALAVIKFGYELEINLLGISSLSLPSVYVELAFSVQFAPARGIFMARGLLTANSYVLFPGLKLSGGFAVGFWFSGDHAGDFVVSMGGYHPRYKVPSHFPDNIPRIGIYGKLDGYVTLSGELYFALTPQAIMAGLSLKVVYSDGWLYASISLRADFIVLWKPFYYEADIAVDVYVRFTIGKGILSKDFSFHLSAGLMVWGPEFSGKAFLDAGIKTFKISFGANAPKFAPDLTWTEFRNSFIPPAPCSINVTGGLINKVTITPEETGEQTEVWIINPKELELITDAIIPSTTAALGSDVLFAGNTFPVPGIAPMSLKTFEAQHKITLYAGWGNGRTAIQKGDAQGSKFHFEQVTKNLPKALWGKDKPDSRNPPDGDNSLMKGLLAGVKITAVESAGGDTRNFKEAELAFVQTVHTANVNAMKGNIEKDAVPVEKNVSFQDYLSATEVRSNSLQALSGILPEQIIDVADLSGKIPVYTYTEPFIETRLLWNK